MKKKYVIEVEESNKTNVDLGLKEKWETPGVYLNTDEKGNITLVYVPVKETYYPMWFMDGNNGSHIIDLLKSVPVLEKAPDPELLELQSMPEIVTGISEATLLKAIAISQRPELSMNLLMSSEDEEKAAKAE